MTKTTHYQGRYLRLVSDQRWEYVERTKASGVVAVLAITPDNRILLVEQFRPPLGVPVIEIPAGLAGDQSGSEHEPLAEAARRELVEETGYSAASLHELGTGPSSAGLTNELITFFEARQLTQVSEGGGDGSESITVHAIPLTELRSWLESRERSGSLTDFKIWAALAMAGRCPPV